MVSTSPRRVCWWGKLPARGDFIGRGLPPRWRADWDAWLQRGLALAADAVPADVLRQRLGAFDPWRYVALPTTGDLWCGVLVPSHDRSGRVFPLTLVERLAAPCSPSAVAARLAPLLPAAQAGPDALEAAIAALPHPDLPRSSQPWPRHPAGLWWPLSAQGDANPRVSDWPPEPALLLDLLAIQSGSQQIASAE